MTKLIIFAFFLFIIVSSSEGTETRELVDPRNKRGLLDATFEWSLSFPGIDWIKTVGSTRLGAAFGVFMRNNFDFQISLLSGHVQGDVHNEIFARAYVLGLNFHISLARVCYKGGARYDLNLQEVDLRANEAMGRLLTEGIRYVAKAITTSMVYISDVMTGKITILNIIDDFLQAFKSLPANMDNLLSFSDPRKFLNKFVSNLMSDINVDVGPDGIYIRIGASCGNGYSKSLTNSET